MIIEFEGCKIIAKDESVNFNFKNDPLLPGQLYIAKRNTGWKLLTCKSVTMMKSPMETEPDFIVPQEMAYCFDSWECFKVLGIE